MPRPGPRPYECVRRAWHSDRHQPMRGSIIQQIFRFDSGLGVVGFVILAMGCVCVIMPVMCLIRVVTEAHSSATKKNREWKEKLPVVVLRAEEIIYSKANSEAEYMNLETLWGRVNDAVDTIIRRDESSETGDLLPPCVEAALNLGCVPVRASRSQRHNNPRTYLTPRGQDPPSPLSPNRPNTEHASPRVPAHASNQLTHLQPRVTTCTYPILYDNTPCNYKRIRNAETSSSPVSGSVYPLYYGGNYPAERSHLTPGVPDNRYYENTILVGTPVGTSVVDAPRFPSYENGSNIAQGAEPEDSYRMGNCDLSLRLGLSSEPNESISRSLENAGSSYSQDFSFFSRESYYDRNMFK